MSFGRIKPRMLVLASASPRRQELLRNAGIAFTVQAADVDETPFPGESARDCAERLAREKALTVWRTRPQDLVLGADTIVVVDKAILGKPVDADDASRMLRLLSGRVHEVITGVCVVKPVPSSQYSVRHSQFSVGSGQGPVSSGAGGRDQGAEISESPVVRGRGPGTSKAYAESAIENPEYELRTGSETTRVTISELSDEEIRQYVETGEPMDKAGAYAIQGMGSRWIPRIEGDYSNVVGLPVALVWRMLRE